jgi:hypothetical protein
MVYAVSSQNNLFDILIQYCPLTTSSVTFIEALLFTTTKQWFVLQTVPLEDQTSVMFEYHLLATKMGSI